MGHENGKRMEVEEGKWKGGGKGGERAEEGTKWEKNERGR